MTKYWALSKVTPHRNRVFSKYEDGILRLVVDTPAVDPVKLNDVWERFMLLR